MPRTATIVLAETEYQIKELPGRKNAQWRSTWGRQLTEKYRELAECPNATPEDRQRLVELTNEWANMIVQSIIAYAPELEADRERIENGYYDDEIIDANNALQDLVSPFVGPKKDGQKQAPTSPS